MLVARLRRAISGSPSHIFSRLCTQQMCDTGDDNMRGETDEDSE